MAVAAADQLHTIDALLSPIIVAGENYGISSVDANPPLYREVVHDMVSRAIGSNCLVSSEFFGDQIDRPLATILSDEPGAAASILNDVADMYGRSSSEAEVIFDAASSLLSTYEVVTHLSLTARSRGEPSYYPHVDPLS